MQSNSQDKKVTPFFPKQEKLDIPEVKENRIDEIFTFEELKVKTTN